MNESSRTINNTEVTIGNFLPDNNLPTVTVSVITYNSSKYILETLNSIKRQSYPNLILQVSDDCSQDRTINICRQWIEENLDRFIKCKIIVTEHNTGVSVNCNRALDNCETKYYKSIAGDDLLLPNCIEDNVCYMEESQDAIVVFSKARPFSVICGIKCEHNYLHDYDFFNKSTDLQYKSLIEVGNTLPASSVFFNIELMRKEDIRYDERIPLLEDYPQWLAMLRKGIRFHYFDKDTVLYRLNNNSLSVGCFSPHFYKNNVLFYLYYFLDEIQNENDRDKVYNIIANHETLFYTRCYNAARNRRIIRLIDYIKITLLNPIRLLKSIFSKSIVKDL